MRRQLDAEDVKIYKAWLRRTAAVYAGLVLFGAVAVVTVAITKGQTADTYLAAATSNQH
jgi:hypothetical protein